MIKTAYKVFLPDILVVYVYTMAGSKSIIFWKATDHENQSSGNFQRSMRAHDKWGMPIKSAITIGKYEEFLFNNPSINPSFDFSITSVTGYDEQRMLLLLLLLMLFLLFLLLLLLLFLLWLLLLLFVLIFCCCCCCCFCWCCCCRTKRDHFYLFSDV